MAPGLGKIWSIFPRASSGARAAREGQSCALAACRLSAGRGSQCLCRHEPEPCWRRRLGLVPPSDTGCDQEDRRRSPAASRTRSFPLRTTGRPRTGDDAIAGSGAGESRRRNPAAVSGRNAHRRSWVMGKAVPMSAKVAAFAWIARSISHSSSSCRSRRSTRCGRDAYHSRRSFACRSNTRCTSGCPCDLVADVANIVTLLWRRRFVPNPTLSGIVPEPAASRGVSGGELRATKPGPHLTAVAGVMCVTTDSAEHGPLPPC